MPKKRIFQDLSLAPYTKDHELWRWLYQQLRLAIQEGRLRPGSRLPSTREIAEQYQLSRGTVVAAFNQLHAEGYTCIEKGTGTYVAFDLATQLPPGLRHKSEAMEGRSAPALSRRANDLIKDVNVLPPSRSVGKAFRSFEPAIDLFPTELWARVSARVLRRAPRSLYGHGDAAGYRPLRVAIAEYVGSARGVHCTPDQILITTGSQQGLDLIARMLVDPGDSVWVEDPGYPGARHVLKAAGARLVPVPVDEQGIDVSAGVRLASRAKVVYVTPANQFPLGVSMSAERRLALLNWAAMAGAWIVEDEFDAEYRYRGRPIAALQALDRSDSVIYVGTFTKMLFNAIRIGFIVLPSPLIRAFTTLRSLVDRHGATLSQATLAEFINEGYYGQHVRKMRQAYADRQKVLLTACHKQLSDLLHVDEAVAGMRTVGWLKRHRSDREIAAEAGRAGLEVFSLSSFSLCHFHKPALLLGFAGCDAHELRRGVRALASILQSSDGGRKPSLPGKE